MIEREIERDLMEDEKIIYKDMIKSNIVNKWIKIIDKELISKIHDYQHQKKIIILYEPDTYIDFYSLFNKPFDGYPLSIENYIKQKLRNNNLSNYGPILEFGSDPLGLGKEMVFICVQYYKYTEFERVAYDEWELIVNSGIIDNKVWEMLRFFQVSCIIHTDRSSKDLIRHEKVFYNKVKKGYPSIYERIDYKLKSSLLGYLHPFCEYVNDPRGLNTKVFRFGVTRNIKELSPRFNQLIKSSK